MLDIDEMGTAEMHALLRRTAYGHLGCVIDGHPYVVPMHYSFEDQKFYLFTTEGMKTQAMDANPEVCLQVEEIHTLFHWSSVVVRGQAQRLTQQDDIDQAMQFIKAHNPDLLPAINRTWIDAWGRENVKAIYYIHPSEMTGRTTDGASST